jgi:hypothetical protein
VKPSNYIGGNIASFRPHIHTPNPVFAAETRAFLISV